jgi:hypothetical protein
MNGVGTSYANNPDKDQIMDFLPIKKFRCCVLTVIMLIFVFAFLHVSISFFGCLLLN